MTLCGLLFYSFIHKLSGHVQPETVLQCKSGKEKILHKTQNCRNYIYTLDTIKLTLNQDFFVRAFNHIWQTSSEEFFECRFVKVIDQMSADGYP